MFMGTLDTVKRVNIQVIEDKKGLENAKVVESIFKEMRTE
jgi:hypothetical protein